MILVLFVPQLACLGTLCINSKQVLHLTSTPTLSKIRSAGILSIWQKAPVATSEQL